MTETVAFITFSRHYVVLYSAAIPAYIDSFLFDEGFSRASFEASSTQLHLSLFLSPVLKASFICWRNLSLVFISGFCSMRAFPNHYWIWGHRKLWLAWELFFAGTPTTKPAFLSFLFSRRVAKSFWSAVSTRIPFPLIFFTWFTLNFSATSETILKTASLVLSELLATPWLAGTIVIAFGGSLFVLVIAAIPDRNANAFGINHIQFNRLPLGFFHGTFQRTLLELSIIL